MVCIGAIKSDNWAAYKWPEIFAKYWQEIEREGIKYKQITSFSHYFTQEVLNNLEKVFDSEDSYQEWLNMVTDTTIEKVEYDWVLGKAHITIKHGRIYSFSCSTTWTEQDCINAIASLNL